MEIKNKHPFKISHLEAIKIQEKIASYINLNYSIKAQQIKLIGGCDIAYKKDLQIGGVIISKCDKLRNYEIIEREYYVERVNFPYIPGLLAFREIPVLIKVFKKIKNCPDLLLVDGQGIAHPRGVGLASHLGYLLDIPTIGWAKSKLIGDYPDIKKGKIALEHNNEVLNFDNYKNSKIVSLKYNNKKIGFVVYNKNIKKPAFVSPGYKISLDSTRLLIKYLIEENNIQPFILQKVHNFVEEIKRNFFL